MYPFISGCFIVSGTIANGQPVSYSKTPAVGVHLAYLDFRGVGKSFGRDMKPGVALHFQNSFSKRFDYSVTLAGAFLEFPEAKDGSQPTGKKELLIENDFAVRAKWLPKPALFNPYALAGAGWSQYDGRYGVYAPVGLGVQVNITPDLFVLANSQYRIAVTSSQHRHFFHSIGVAGTITRRKIVKTEPTPLPVPVIKPAAPTDVDGDGIFDNVDSCPQVAGVIRYFGCPVSDRDADGINDEEDECPEVKGVLAYKGCPMPDKDHDGVADPEDKCPEMPGSAVNAGCPEIATLKSWLNWAAQHIYFETGSHHLLPRSFPVLDSVAALLKNYPMLQMVIEGHTDNVGGTKYNQTLSDKRAGAVMEYFVKAGVDASRLQAVGYGSQQPVATNATPAGRAANRRVVLKVR